MRTRAETRCRRSSRGARRKSRLRQAPATRSLRANDQSQPRACTRAPSPMRASSTRDAPRSMRRRIQPPSRQTQQPCSRSLGSRGRATASSQAAPRRISQPQQCSSAGRRLPADAPYRCARKSAGADRRSRLDRRSPAPASRRFQDTPGCDRRTRQCET